MKKIASKVFHKAVDLLDALVEKALMVYAMSFQPFGWLVSLAVFGWKMISPVLRILWWPVYFVLVGMDVCFTSAGSFLGCMARLCWLLRHDYARYMVHPNQLSQQDREKYPMGYVLLHCQYCHKERRLANLRTPEVGQSV